MAQMYKVFFRNKELVFTDSDFIFDERSKKIESFHRSNIQTFLTGIECDENYDRYVYSASDFEKQFTHFYMSMKIITAAGGLVRNKSNALLMIFRRNTWDLPKGKIDYGETEEQTAIREVEEETGLRGLSIEKRLTPTFHVYGIGAEWVLKETHWFLMSCSKPDKYKPQAEEGITNIRWISKQNILGMIPLLYPSLRSLVRGIL